MASILRGPMDTQTQAIPAVPGTSPSACTSCGAQVEPGQRYCLSCGEPISAVPEAQPAAAQPAGPARAGGVTPGVAAACVCLAVLFLAVGILVGRLSFGDAVNGSNNSQSSSTVQQSQSGTTFNGGAGVPNNGTANTAPAQPQTDGTTIPGNTTQTTSPAQQVPPPTSPTP